MKQQAALRWTSATRRCTGFALRAVSSSRTIPFPAHRHARMNKRGRPVSPICAKRRTNRERPAPETFHPATGANTRISNVANTPFSKTARAETRYTPPMRAGVRKDGMDANAVPRKFHAKPLKSTARAHSRTVQSAASAKMHKTGGNHDFSSCLRQRKDESQPYAAK